jgi:hypothetical protein
MFRGTGDVGHLVRLADHAQSVLAQRDSALGLTDYTGASRPCWQATKYTTTNQPYCFVVHSGMLAYPMADLALLVSQSPALQSHPLPGGQTLGQAAQSVLAEVEKIVATHDFQYKSGPGAGEGYYQGDPGAAALISFAGKAMPLNQMNAMGRTLVALWKATGKAAHQQKAQALAAYLKNRMTVSGATYLWTYWGDAWSSGKGEDISHASINADFAALCHQHGIVFNPQDMARLGRTLFEKIHKDTDTTADNIDGSGGTNTYKWAVGRWLSLAPFEPRAWAVAANIYRDLTTTTDGSALLGLANVARHAPPLREYTFYHVDWNDLGDHRKATAYGANILLEPVAPTQAHALRLGYRATLAASVDQWDGAKYHANQRLPATSGSAFVWVYVPYDPKIYLAYSQNKVLYQLTDAYVAGQGIEVKEVAAVQVPTIATQQAPPATVGVPYALTLQGSGDPPLLWSLTAAPAGMTVDLQTGALSWTPAAADVPAVQLQVRLVNDAGQATTTLSIQVIGTASDGGHADGSVSDGAGDGPPAFGGDGLAGDGGGTVDGCGCGVGRRPVGRGASLCLLALLGLALLRRRDRGVTGRAAPRRWDRAPGFSRRADPR